MKTVLGLGLCLFVLKANAQNPVTLKYQAKKLGDKKYEIVITAHIDEGWHLYSQVQPETSLATPTEIKFNKNPLITVKGKTKEKGEMKKHIESGLGIEAWQYDYKVEFVQTISLKTNAKTNISGTITYQTCTDERCLPPKTVSFSVPVQ